MAIIDSRLEFSVKQAVSSSGASTNTIDLGVERNIGVGTPMYIVVQVATSVTAALTATVETSKTETSGFAAIGSVVIPTTAKAGSTYVIGMPMENYRYLRLNYAGSGTVNAYLTDQHPGLNKHYPAV